MSMTSRFLFGVGLALVLLACSVNAHGWMSYPVPRGQYTQPPKPAYMEYAPATRDPMDPAIICRDDPEMPKAQWLPLQAGKSQQITLEFNALHVGDCFVYLTYDGDKSPSEMKWFKIWEQHACKNSNQYTIDIPSYLPSGEHVIFRWEWYALHVYPIVEYYSQCVDATMSGSASGSLPNPQVNIPGHLPYLSGNFADDTNNYWWPWDNQPMKFTGPALATLDGQPAPSNPIPPSKPTSAPTNPPAATPAPPAGPAPTTKPIAPTEAPITLPVNDPPAQSVKLNVLRDISVWWFAASVSGHRANEVAKMEVKDSGSFPNFTPMSLGWSEYLDDVWVFDPAHDGPITYPVVVKVSLPSGSSLSFLVNGLQSTVLDSGVVFP